MGALALGALLLGTAVMVSASGTSGETDCKNPSCVIIASPATGLTFASPLQVSGSDFTPEARGAVSECNMAPGEPTVAIPNNPVAKITQFGSLPVGCSPPSRSTVQVEKNGTIFAGMGIETNQVGPPVEGTDSSGGSAATDAAAYPCPPTQSQVSAGVSCAIVFRDTRGKGKRVRNETAFTDISFSTPFSTTTTTATTIPTPPGCNAVPTGSSAQNSRTGNVATVMVTPGSCLVAGVQVSVTAVGLVPQSIGSITECNSDPGQPTMSYLGATIPVSCSKPVIISTSATGTIPPADQAFTITEGTVGPPATGTDSSGGSAATDAALYPCPPTAAQLAAGDVCTIDVGDLGADRVGVPIWFYTAPVGG